MSLCQTPDPQVGMKRLRVFLFSLWFVAGFVMGCSGWAIYNAPSAVSPPAPISPYIARAG